MILDYPSSTLLGRQNYQDGTDRHLQHYRLTLMESQYYCILGTYLGIHTFFTCTGQTFLAEESHTPSAVNQAIRW